VFDIVEIAYYTFLAKAWQQSASGCRTRVAKLHPKISC